MAALRRVLGATVVFVGAGAVVGCGGGGGGGIGGSPASANVPHPLVRQFSPTMSPIDFATGIANPTYTDGMLLVSTDPAYPGKIVIFFNPTKLDPKTVFQSGDPTNQLDPNSIQILRYIPGTGNVPLAAAANGVVVQSDRIIFTPATLPLPDGQYSIGVFDQLKSIEGDPVDQSPVFHSFTVGAIDTIPPTIVTTVPVNNAVGIGAGAPPPPPQKGTSSVADVRTAIFGPTSPDIIIRFNESIAAATVSALTVKVVDAGAFVPGGGAPPAIVPDIGFPKLKSQIDASSLPSNGFEIVWRADPKTGFPYGTTIQVTVVGADAGGSPIADRSGNKLALSYTFQFQTLRPPNLPENPEPEYSVYWSAGDRFGVLDTIDFKQIAQTFLGNQTTRIIKNVLPKFNDTIATKSTLGGSFDPNEISVDARTSGASCHTYCYVQSFNSGEVMIINSRNSMPVAIIKTPSPGGLSNQTGTGQSANVLLVTNSSANTFTEFDLTNITPGLMALSGPIGIGTIHPTGNTPRSISITAPGTQSAASIAREFAGTGPLNPLIMYVDFVDGVINTANLAQEQPIKQIALGAGSSPNDVSIGTCWVPGPGIPPVMWAAISQGGGVPGEGKVSYYIAGPNCGTGSATGGLAVYARPDAIVGTLDGFDAPAGLDDLSFPNLTNAFFAMAESGSTKNDVVTLANVALLNVDTPKILRTIKTGANPVAVSHVSAWYPPNAGGWICRIGTPGCPNRVPIPAGFITSPPCWYEGLLGTEQFPVNIDGSGEPCLWLYVCSRGAGQIDVFNATSGAAQLDSPIAIPGIRNVGTQASQ